MSDGAATGATKRCLIAIDAPQGMHLLGLTLPVAADLAGALECARARCADADVDWQGAVAGIWGQIQPRTVIPRDGDRIELYRALPADPRQRRRQRASATSAGRGRGGAVR